VRVALNITPVVLVSIYHIELTDWKAGTSFKLSKIFKGEMIKKVQVFDKFSLFLHSLQGDLKLVHCFYVSKHFKDFCI
jgi:hypothetical protein